LCGVFCTKISAGVKQFGDKKQIDLRGNMKIKHDFSENQTNEVRVSDFGPYGHGSMKRFSLSNDGAIRAKHKAASNVQAADRPKNPDINFRRQRARM
jgi:hypothetical protein